jgi:hypothetical protein
MEFVMEDIILMRGVTTLAHFSRSPPYCAHGIGKSVNGFGKQHMVLASILMRLTTLALLPRGTLHMEDILYLMVG